MARYDPKPPGTDGRKISRRIREETIVTSDGTTERLELEERDQEEYYYTNPHTESRMQRNPPTDSGTLTVNFPNDDRLVTTTVSNTIN
uniref:YTV domain-containing protein n=1 Tax=Syphacia muris TaxID=451379 RepID=A0A0N5B0V0_9BILA